MARFSNINFFASQGPLQNTCVHHLQMIFEHDIDIVILLTKLKENDNRGKTSIEIGKLCVGSIINNCVLIPQCQLQQVIP